MSDRSMPGESDRPPPLPAGDWVWERLAAFPEIRELALQHFPREEVERFMTTPQPGFGDRSPLEVMASGRSDLVYDVLAADHERFPY
jgi:uncharacterized protein (DUF2384 family)